MSLLFTDGGEGASEEEMAPGGRGEEESGVGFEGAALRAERGGIHQKNLARLYLRRKKRIPRTDRAHYVIAAQGDQGDSVLLPHVWNAALNCVPSIIEIRQHYTLALEENHKGDTFWSGGT